MWCSTGAVYSFILRVKNEYFKTVFYIFIWIKKNKEVKLKCSLHKNMHDNLRAFLL